MSCSLIGGKLFCELTKLPKVILLVVLLSITLSSNAQEITNFSRLDTIASVCGVTYLNTYDQIWQYHESDWVLAETVSDEEGKWMYVFYDDASIEPKVYVYWMQEEICYRLAVYTDPKSVLAAEEMLEARAP